MRVSFCFASWNRWPQFERTLRSILRQPPPEGVEYEFSVINDGSTDDPEDAFRRLVAPHSLVWTRREPHRYRSKFLVPHNMAVAQSTGKVVVLGNPENLHVGPTVPLLLAFTKRGEAAFLWSKPSGESYRDDPDDGNWRAHPADEYDVLGRKERDWYAHPKEGHVGTLFYVGSILREDWDRFGGYELDRTKHRGGGGDLDLHHRMNDVGFKQHLVGSTIDRPEGVDCLTVHQWHERPWWSRRGKTFVDNRSISFCFPVYNRWDLLARTIRSILRQSPKNAEFSIVNDGSTVSPERGFRKLVEPYPLVWSNRPRHKYTPRALTPHNAAVAQSSGEVIVLGNPENLHIGPTLPALRGNVSPRRAAFLWCLSLAPSFAEEPDDLRWRDHIASAPGDVVPDIGGQPTPWYSHPELRPTHWFWCGAVLREDWDSVGGYDISRPGGGDADLERRMRRAGFDLALVGDCRNRHGRGTDLMTVHQWHTRQREQPW